MNPILITASILVLSGLGMLYYYLKNEKNEKA